MAKAFELDKVRILGNTGDPAIDKYAGEIGRVVNIEGNKLYKELLIYTVQMHDQDIIVNHLELESAED